jgi:dethiobiotin synthetase
MSKTPQRIFVTGISTEVGKTVASAVLVRALKADYWKPIQCGDLHDLEFEKVLAWADCPESEAHPSSHLLEHPMSPHAAAERSGIRLKLSDFTRPNPDKTLVIEGAGGVLVPLNDTDTVADLMQPGDQVVVVSRHYLGSINHSLLTAEVLKARGIQGFWVFNGDPNPETESVILSKTGWPLLGRLLPEPEIDADCIDRYAQDWGRRWTQITAEPKVSEAK